MENQNSPKESNLKTRKCHYCGSEKSNGIDRIDSSLGYLPDNVLPCCKICNYMKNNHSYKFFVEHIKKIVENIV